MEDASGTFWLFFGGDMEAASSLSLITLPFLSAILRLEGLDLLNLPLSRNLLKKGQVYLPDEIGFFLKRELLSVWAIS
jgi:hypothetical protein